MHRHRIVVLIALTIAVPLLGVPAATATVAYQSSSNSRLMIASDHATGATWLGVPGNSPLISPDGTRVAYIGGTSSHPRLHIRTIATGAEVVVAAAPGTSVGMGSQWAPDSAHLAMPTESATAAGYITGAGLDIIDAVTGGVTVVFAPKAHDVAGWSWAPSSDRLVYASRRYGANFGHGVMRIVGLDGVRIATLGTGENPLWGPRRIAFQRFTTVRWQGSTVQHAQLWTANPASPGVNHQLTHYPSAGLIYGPYAVLWSPDGTVLYGGIGGEDVSMPGRISARTGHVKRLRDGRGKKLNDASIVALSADGRRLLLDTGEIGGSPVYRTMPAGNGAVRVFLRHAYGLTVQSSWQP